MAKAASAISILCAVSMLGAAKPAGGAPVMPPPANDGPPSADACAKLGFTPTAQPETGGYGGRSFGGRVKAAPSTMAPSPLPVPPVERRLEEVIVSGVRAPPPPSPPPMQDALRAPSPAIGGAYMPPPRDTERYPDATPNPIKRVAEAPVSTFSIDVDTASYANARRFLNDGRKPPRDAVRVEEMINYFDYGYAKPTSREVPFRPTVAVAPSPWSPGKQLIHIGLQGYDLPRADQPPMNLVFLIDVSGSMSSEDRLPLAKKALNVLIDQLRPQDRVAIVAYAGAAGAVLSPTDGRQKLKMRCALGALGAGGSTAGGEGLALAYALAQQNFARGAVNRVILMTDGDFNVGVTDTEKLEDFVAEKRKTGVYLSVYGFGRGNYNDTMMQTLSQSGNGTAAYVDSLNEARKLFRDDLGGSVFPIADDVKIQVEFNPARVAEYRLVGYETRMLNREDFNNDQVDAGEIGSNASVTALYEITPVGGPLSSDPLRYGREPQARAGAGELAFLKIRYKLPGQPDSRLMDRAIGAEDGFPSLAAAPEATRWAVAVAGYGQRLRGDAYIPDSYRWSDIGALAQGARGADPFGQRAEFVQLVRAADSGRSVNE